jgi:hypothetical protein
MGGKLPIDRAREPLRDPKRAEEEKRKLAEKEARLERQAREYDDETPSDEGARPPSEDEA